MEGVVTKSFDLFLSYSRKDETFAKRLHVSLQQRGVICFLDQSDIHPGELYEQKIFSDIANSQAYGMVVTNDGLKSDWVQREYSFASKLYEQGKIKIIPLLYQRDLVNHPLASHNGLAFWDEAKYEENLTRLIFPGLTDRDLLALSFSDTRPSNLFQLEELLDRRGVHCDPVGSVYRGRFALEVYLNNFAASRRIVVVVDLFDETYESVEQKLELVFKYRELTRNKPNEIVFLFAHKSGMLQKCAERIDKAFGQGTTARLNHYFQINTDLPSAEFERHFDAVWIKIQRELLRVRSAINPV